VHQRRFPLTRAECESEPRPCPHTRCKYQLPLGECALDHADKGGMTLAEVGDIFGISRERVRQIEDGAMKKVKEALEKLGVEPSYNDPESMWDDENLGDDDGY